MSSSSPNQTSYTLPSTGAQALANYPHARLVASSGRTMFVSGTSSRRADGTYAGCIEDSHTGAIVAVDCAAQTAAVLANIETILRGATDGRCGLDAVVDATVFLTDMHRDYAAMNAEWNRVWPDPTTAPARTCVEVSALPGKKGRLCVEIKCQAVLLG